jgi:hypothetical protein
MIVASRDGIPLDDAVDELVRPASLPVPTGRAPDMGSGEG